MDKEDENLLNDLRLIISDHIASKAVIALYVTLTDLFSYLKSMMPVDMHDQLYKQIQDSNDGLLMLVKEHEPDVD